MNTNVSHDSKDRLPELANIDAKLLGILIGKGVVREYSASDVSAMKTEIETLKAKYASVDPSEIASLTEREAQLRKKITIRLSGHFEGFWYDDIWSKRAQRKILQNASKVRMILSSDFADRIARAEKYLTDRASKEVSRQYAYNHEAGKIGSKIAEYAYLPSRIEALEKEIAKIEGSFERLGYYYVFTPEADRYVRKISKTPIQENSTQGVSASISSKSGDSMAMDLLYWNIITLAFLENGNRNGLSGSESGSPFDDSRHPVQNEHYPSF